MTFVDTNIFLRFFLDDLDDQHQKAKQLFKAAAQNKKKLTTNHLVFFEVFWVLKSYYELDEKVIKTVLSGMLDMVFIKIENRLLLKQTLDIFDKEPISLEDSYHLATALDCHAEELVTFDKKLKKSFSKYL